MSAHPIERTDLATMAEVVHHATGSEPTVIAVTPANRGTDIGFWPVPRAAGHPTNVLIGWRPEAQVEALGLTAPSWATPLAQGSTTTLLEAGRNPCRLTVLASRSGGSATVFECDGMVEVATPARIEGWLADALHRCLSLATPAPANDLVASIETRWLERILRAIGSSERAGRTSVSARPLAWDDLALLHPLAPEGGPASPDGLADVVQEMARLADWRHALAALRDEPALPSPVPHPPGGSIVADHEWFDPGSLSRWVSGPDPSSHDLLWEVLDALDPAVARYLVDALTAVGLQRDGRFGAR